MTSIRLPVVAVVGRPNVGKSTLVNRIIGSRSAVVQEKPGVTRDRREFDADWAGRPFILVDTGGWEMTPGEPISQGIREQAEAAVSSADLVLFVVDARTGAVDDDDGIATTVRASGVPVLLAANKLDDAQDPSAAAELWSLGLGEPLGISALHGLGIGDLLDRLVDLMPDDVAASSPDEIPSLAIIGRPNVGKSTLLNRLVGDRRVLVSEIPGTTRDPIDVSVDLDGRTYRLVDTAGIRRAPRIKEDADYYSVLRARSVLQDANVALLLIDATEGVTHQDQRIAGEVVEAGTALIVVLNKWDAIDDESRRRVESDLGERFGFVSWAPVIRMSSLTGARVHRLGGAVELVLESAAHRIPTGSLNRLVREWTAAHPPPVRGGRRPKILYAVQAGTAPPTFVVFVGGGDLGPDYLRFLEGRIRGVADFTGTPIHVTTRSRRKERART